jgi:hypothetical protein
MDVAILAFDLQHDSRLPDSNLVRAEVELVEPVCRLDQQCYLLAVLVRTLHNF